MNLWNKDEIVEVIQTENLFIVSSHVGPDGDNVGSSCALVSFLRKLGKEAYYVMNEDLPTNLNFLWEVNNVISSEEAKKTINGRAYTSIFMDCGDINRISCDRSIIQNSQSIINIDHHESNNGYGKYNLVNKKASSTCQVLYELLEAIDEEKISSDIATSIYTGIVTDSGNFKFSSADYTTLDVATKLLKKNADKELIMTRLYRNHSLGMINLTAKVLSTLEKTKNYTIMQMTKQMIEDTNVDYNNTDSLVDYAIEIDGVDIGCFIKEKDTNLIKISLRSKTEKFNMSKLAGELGGGGHIMAAGCTLEMDIEDAKDIIKSKIEEYIKNV